MGFGITYSLGFLYKISSLGFSINVRHNTLRILGRIFLASAVYYYK